MTRDGRVTFSDVDLLTTDRNRSRHAWEEDIVTELAKQGWDIRVSVQQFDPLICLHKATSCLLSFGELVRFLPDMHGCRQRAYLYSKTSLGVLGILHPTESGAAIEYASEGLGAAWLARVGFNETFNEASCLDLLRNAADSNEVAEAYIELLRSNDWSAARQWFLRKLDMSAVHPWMRNRYHELLARP